MLGQFGWESSVQSVRHKEQEVSGFFFNSLVRHICTWELFLGSLEAWRKRVTNELRPLYIPLVSFTMQMPNSTRGSKSLVPDLRPSETRKMQLLPELPGLAWPTCPAVTAFNHMRPVFHQELLKSADRQTREAIWPGTGGICRLKSRISQCLLYPVYLSVSWLLFIKRQL